MIKNFRESFIKIDISERVPFLLLFLLLVLYHGKVNGQSTLSTADENILKGRVLSQVTDNPVKGAEIKIESIGDRALQNAVRGISDEEGEFTLRFKAKLSSFNSLVVSVSHPNYPIVRNEITYIPGEKYAFKIQPSTERIRLKGKISDEETGEAISFSSVLILPADKSMSLAKPLGTSTDLDGFFDLSFNYSTPFRIRFSHISYQPEIILVEDLIFKNLDVKLTPKVFVGDQINVFSNLVDQNELESVNTFDTISNIDIQQVASLNTFDLVSTLREVDVSTQSMNLQSVSTRGFNATANPRFLQLTDGADNMAPGLGFPIGNLLGPSELDIASIELKVGASTTRYGSNALSGVLLTESKDPFLTEGVSASAKAGMHNFKFGGADPWAVEGEGIYDVSLRYADSFNDKFAFKIDGTFISGLDWEANNYDNLGPRESWMYTDEDPGYNGINTYADERYVYLPVGFDVQGNPDGSFTPVTRTGYKESNLVDYDIATRKFSASAQYKIREDSRIKLEGRYGYTNTLFTGDSRIRLQNFEMFQVQTELQTKHFLLRAYTTKQYSGESYNVNTLADLLNTSVKSDADWYRDFRIAYEQGLPVYGVRANDITAAREFADSGVTLLDKSNARKRLEPDTPAFEEELQRIIGSTGFDQGAGIRDDSQLYHAEMQNDFGKVLKGIDLLAGGSFRFYDVDSKGTIFPDTTNNDITNYQFSGFLQFEKTLLEDDLRTVASFRFEKNENFKVNLSQNIGLNYNIGAKHYFRFSYQNGFRIPSVREQFLNTNVGRARLVGGLRNVNSVYDLAQNAFTQQSVDAFNEAVFDDLDNGFNRPQAELANLNILEDGILAMDGLASLKPEKTHAFEVGYRQLVNKKLYFDVNYFVSFYRDFIGIKRLVKPRTSPATDLFAAAEQINNRNTSDRYFVFNNAESGVTAQGFAFDVTYISGNFVSSLNGTWTRLFKSPNDPIIPGYNTPPYKLNFEWGNREIITNVGFKMTFRARSAFDWKSSFLDGRVPGYGHFDFQFNIRFPEISSILKFGVTNMGVNQHYDTFGGPAIGSILFTTLTFTP